MTDAIFGVAAQILLDAILCVLTLKAIGEEAHVVVVAQDLGQSVYVIESEVAQEESRGLDDDHGLLERGAGGEIEHPSGEDTENQSA